MTSKKFIGGGFPGIKECIKLNNEITKESIVKREFSIGRKSISISNILKTKRINTEIQPKLNVHNTFYDSIENLLHNPINELKTNRIYAKNQKNKKLRKSKSKKSKSKKLKK
jgi:hypothetical protein